ncbi:MAG: HEAT repeat domain-containing protein [Planctomycetota bacterium]|nr:HEAT repeat domain-containing protein [Planctomycetota bacterium]
MAAKVGKAEVQKALGEIKLMDAGRRAQAAITLGLYGDDHVLPALKQAARDSAAQVKVAALYSLCLLGDKEAIPQLIPFLSTDRPRSRKLALTALEQSTDVKHGGDSEDVESCKKAEEAWSAWWKQNSAKVKWAQEKKRYTL